MKQNRGFSLLEMLITVTIVGILFAIAVPNVTETIRTSQLRTSADNLFSLIRYARSEAARQGITVYVGAFDGVSWTNGLVVWTEANGNGIYNNGVDIILRRSTTKGPSSIVEATNKKLIAFSGQGYTTAAATFDVCDSKRRGESGKTISILASGFASMQKKAVACD